MRKPQAAGVMGRHRFEVRRYFKSLCEAFNDEQVGGAFDSIASYLGAPCAAAVLGRVEVMALQVPQAMRAAESGEHLLPPAQMRATLQRIEKLAAELGAELGRHGVADFMAWTSKPTNQRRPGPLHMPWQAESAERMRAQLDHLHALALHAADFLPLWPGSAPEQTPTLVVSNVVWVVGAWGHPLASGESSRLVRALRDVWQLLGWPGDPRDRLRRLTKAGALDLKAYEQECRQRLEATGDLQARAMDRQWLDALGMSHD